MKNLLLGLLSIVLLFSTLFLWALNCQLAWNWFVATQFPIQTVTYLQVLGLLLLSVPIISFIRRTKHEDREMNEITIAIADKFGLGFVGLAFLATVNWLVF